MLLFPKRSLGLERGCTSTMRNALIRHTTTGRRGKSTRRNTGGYVDDRLRRPAAPSTTYPPAQPSARGSIMTDQKVSWRSQYHHDGCQSGRVSLRDSHLTRHPFCLTHRVHLRISPASVPWSARHGATLFGVPLPALIAGCPLPDLGLFEKHVSPKPDGGRAFPRGAFSLEGANGDASQSSGLLRLDQIRNVHWSLLLSGKKKGRRGLLRPTFLPASLANPPRQTRVRFCVILGLCDRAHLSTAVNRVPYRFSQAISDIETA